MSPKLQPVRGTHDILPDEARKRRYITDTWQAVAALYGFGELQTPVFEFSDVFHRTLGDTSDVVTKETYTFTDRGGESLTLRPEFTASAVRAFLSNGLQNELPLKWFYYGPAFRYERPQKGRLRQFHQIGVELLGVAEPQADVEVIALAAQGLRALDVLPHVRLEINSLGDPESRKNMRDILVAHFTAHKADLSADSQTRLERNPLRILDSKDKTDQEISAAVLHKLAASDYYTPVADAFFTQVKHGLDAMGIAYTVNPRLVRGLDYYNHTVFEFVTDALGAQGTVLAGGRYDGLVSLMGGPDTPGVGFAAGLERMLALMEHAQAIFPVAPKPVAIVPIGEAAEVAAWKLAQSLRQANIAVDISYKGNAGKRLKRADKIGASHAIMLGDDEIAAGTVTLKDLASGEQKAIPIASLINELK